MVVQNADAHAPANPKGARRDDFEDFPRDQYERPKIIRAELNPATGRWEVPRDINGQPVIELVPFTRASTLGGAIEYQGNLHRWKAAVIMWGLAKVPSLIKRVKAVAGYSLPDQKTELYEIADKAKARAEADEAANHGTALHTLFQRIIEGESVDDLIASETIDEEDVAACRAFADAVTRFETVSTETRVVCDEARAAGKYDAQVRARRAIPVTDKRGKVVDVILPGECIAVDYKTSSTPDYFGPKFCVQLWVYSNGRYYDKATGERTETGMSKRWALILHVPRNSDVAEWYWVDLTVGGELVKVARDVLEGRNSGKRAISRANLDAEIPPELLIRAENARAGLLTELERDAEQLPYDVPIDEPPHITEEEYQRQLAGRDPGDVIAGNEPGDAELIEVIAERAPGAHAADTMTDAVMTAYRERVEAEQPTMRVAGLENLTSNGTSSVAISADLAGKLQRSAAVDSLLRRIADAPTLLGLLDLYNKADQHGYMSEEVKAACTARKVELQARARESTAASA